ncbi:AraC-like transcriptional regulator QhpR [Pseudomonas schmalbachii]|uniref:AraC family transcriptional regulator n=1 Tax=Pseudomonas schmalbachii TaxID=2816993 RepID=A0ABS3TN07_9PSED|nr:AraC family transcriptional regulator [Pseudomonas schmalbachii]MBO3274050.1 AraC family transcriptional regulator [Pseudomonas schmalbachii]
MSRLKHTVYAEALLQWYSAIFRPYLAEVGLDEEVLERPDAKIPLNQYYALLEIAAEHTDPCLGLRLGVGLLGAHRSSPMGGVGHAVRSAPDVRTMLDCANRYIVVHSHACEMAWSLKGGRLEVLYRMTDPSVIQRRQDAELTIGLLFARLQEATRNRFTPLRVDFAHARPADIRLHQEIFQCPLRFDQPVNMLVWPGEMLDEPLATADPRLYQALLPGLEEQRRRRLADTDLTTRIGLVIEANLSTGRISIDDVASELCMSRRTLQRRLQELQLEFVELVEEIRQAMAIDLVSQTSFSLTEIALKLGYNEASSFTRAFRRWTGVTPLKFRQQKQK